MYSVVVNERGGSTVNGFDGFGWILQLLFEYYSPFEYYPKIHQIFKKKRSYFVCSAEKNGIMSSLTTYQVKEKYVSTTVKFKLNYHSVVAGERGLNGRRGTIEALLCR